MITVSAQVLDYWLAAILWPLIRMLAVVATMPVLGHRSVPARVKVGLALAATLVIAPTLPATTVPSLFSPLGAVTAAQQVLVGVSIGFTLRIVFAAIELAGELMGLQMGLSFSGFFDPATATQGTPVGAWLGVIATLVFLGMNGHLMVLHALGESFRVVPIGPESLGGADWRRLALLGTELFRIGVYAALPVVAAMLVCNLGLGVLGRVAPQLNLLAVGFSVTLLVGFSVLYLALPVIGAFLQNALERGIASTMIR